MHGLFTCLHAREVFVFSLSQCSISGVCLRAYMHAGILLCLGSSLFFFFFLNTRLHPFYFIPPRILSASARLDRYELRSNITSAAGVFSDNSYHGFSLLNMCCGRDETRRDETRQDKTRQYMPDSALLRSDYLSLYLGCTVQVSARSRRSGCTGYD